MANKARILDQRHGRDWTMYHGDCCDVAKHLPDASVDFTIFSPPFVNLYIYSDSIADMGNCDSHDEFFTHFKFLIPELLRVTTPGRLCAIHCKDLPKYFGRDEATGLIDFPGQCILAFEECGWTFHSRVTIWKCPVTERERTNNNGLLHKTVKRDSSQLRQGMADYLLVFRKVNGQLLSDKPIQRERGFETFEGDAACDPRRDTPHPSKYARTTLASENSINIWRRYAEPVWWDIDQTDVLNGEIARTDRDEKHICPLQLGLIARAVHIWSAPGDVVLSPFAGIGSEGYGSILRGRKFVGIELKDSYFAQACKNLERAEREAQAGKLFSDEVEASA